MRRCLSLLVSVGLGLLLNADGTGAASNFSTFPMPPASAGFVDLGPFVGLWYLGASVQAWRSLGWARSGASGRARLTGNFGVVL